MRNHLLDRTHSKRSAYREREREREKKEKLEFRHSAQNEGDFVSAFGLENCVARSRPDPLVIGSDWPATLSRRTGNGETEAKSGKTNQISELNYNRTAIQNAKQGYVFLFFKNFFEIFSRQPCIDMGK